MAAHLNLAILYSFTGRFELAKEVLDIWWLLAYVVFYCYGLWDSYNQVTREKELWPILYYALLFSAGITAIEYPLELYTNLIKYINWNWITTFSTLTIAFLASRTFIAFFRLGCNYFSQK